MKKSPLTDPNRVLTASDVIDYAGIDNDARTLAVRRLPPAHQTALSKSETDAVELIENRIADRRRNIADLARQIHDRLAELPDPRADRNIAHLPEHVDNLIMGVFHDNTPAIRQTVAAERNATAEYEAWRDEKKLTHRQPNYPTSHILHFSLILFAMIR